MSSPKALTLSKRPAKLGGHLNVRTEKHGDEDVPAVDIAIDGVMLEAEELNVLLGDKSAHKSFFQKATAADSKALDYRALDEPKFPNVLAPLKLLGKFEDASAVLHLNDSEALDLAGVSIKGVVLEPQVGGLTSLSLTVQVSEVDADDLAALSQHLNLGIDVELSFGKRAEKSKKQPELPMGSHTQQPDETLSAETTH